MEVTVVIPATGERYELRGFECRNCGRIAFQHVLLA
jgi:hypothetical protein